MSFSFNMLAMMYMQVAQSKIELKRQANPSYFTKKRSTKLGRRKPTATITRNPNTVNVWPKIEAICRVCGKYGNDNISIFDNTEDRNIVNDMISIATVQVEKNDGLPTHICARCLDLLNNALLFKRSCEKTDRELRKMLTKTDTIKINEEKIDINDPDLGGENLFNEFDQTLISYSEIDNVPMSDEDHNNQGFFDCLKCGKCFLNNDEYEIHLSTCDSIFKKSLYGVKKKKVPEKLPYLCVFCGKMFKQETQLKRHSSVHDDELPFSCDLCPYRGRDKQTLRTHSRTHTGERPYKCPYCPRQFINSSNRKRHLTVHETQRRYKCSICHKGISTKLALKDHERSVHFGMKDYECDMCNSGFGSNKSLIKHRIRIHKKRSAYARVSTYLRQDAEKKSKQLSNANQNQENIPGQDMNFDDPQQYNL